MRLFTPFEDQSQPEWNVIVVVVLRLRDDLHRRSRPPRDETTDGTEGLEPTLAPASERERLRRRCGRIILLLPREPLGGGGRRGFPVSERAR